MASAGNAYLWITTLMIVLLIELSDSQLTTTPFNKATIKQTTPISNTTISSTTQTSTTTAASTRATQRIGKDATTKKIVDATTKSTTKARGFTLPWSTTAKASIYTEKSTTPTQPTSIIPNFPNNPSTSDATVKATAAFVTRGTQRVTTKSTMLTILTQSSMKTSTTQSTPSTSQSTTQTTSTTKSTTQTSPTTTTATTSTKSTFSTTETTTASTSPTIKTVITTLPTIKRTVAPNDNRNNIPKNANNGGVNVDNNKNVKLNNSAVVQSNDKNGIGSKIVYIIGASVAFVVIVVVIIAIVACNQKRKPKKELEPKNGLDPSQYNELPELPKGDTKEASTSMRYSATPKMPKSRENQVEYFQVDLQDGLDRTPLPPVPPKRKFSNFEIESTRPQGSNNDNNNRPQSPSDLPIYSKSRPHVQLPPIPSNSDENHPRSPIAPNFDNRPRSPNVEHFDNNFQRSPQIFKFDNNNPPQFPPGRSMENTLPMLPMTPSGGKNNIPKTTIRIQKDPKPQIHLREIFQQEDPDHSFITPPGANSNSKLPPKEPLTPSSVDSDTYYNLDDFDWDSALDGGIDYDKLYNQYYKCLPRPRLLRLQQISGYIAEMHSRPGSFEQEYLGILQGNLAECQCGMLEENYTKNKFANLVPYDHSRVILPLDGDIHSNSYINASYMIGYPREKNAYIATQGLLPTTINDFWKMVWMTKSNKIVMLGNWREDNKILCSQYWPIIGRVAYGSITVEQTDKWETPGQIIRQFIISKEGSMRSVYHLQLSSWPDNGVPTSTKAFLQFREKVHSYETEGPTIVHCSSGAGATGVYLSLDYLLQQAKETGTVDVVTCVRRMRMYRPNMVQNIGQYIFIYQCLRDAYSGK